MKRLELGGNEVCTSELSQRPFRAVSCELLISVTKKNQKKALAALRKEGELGGNYSGVRVSGLEDLSFLQEFPLLLYLEVVDSKRVNTRQLDGLSNLRGLRLESPGAGLDFACFPQLETFIGNWHSDNRNLAQSGELRRLLAWRFQPRSADLADLAGCVRLEQLHITQTNLTSLAGLESLEDLRYLDITTASKLKSLDVLSSGQSGIRELSVSNAKAIASYRPLAAVKNLRRLKLSTCAAMPDLKWTAGMNQLDFFSFVETTVDDGDLSPLLKLPRLRYVGTFDKRTYNYKCNALNELLQNR
jgi:hypothetical protein